MSSSSSAATTAPARAARTKTTPAPRRSSGSDREPVVVVGAGIGGLTLCRALAQRDIAFVALEREAEPGGVIRTVERAGRILEAGPQRTRLTHTVRELVRMLGLERELLVAPPGLPLFIYRDGALRRAPLSLGELLRTDLLSPLARMRVLAEPLTARAHHDETVAHYFTRRFGGDAYHDLLGPLFGGLYGSDPRDMLVRHALLPTLVELGAGRSAVLALLRRRFQPGRVPPCSFRRGMRALTDAMLASVRDHVRLDMPATGIGRGKRGYRVRTEGGDFDACHVVLTCAADVAARLLETVAPSAAAALASLNYNRIAIVHLLAEGVTPGMGYQVSLAEPLLTRGVTFNHSLFGRDGLYTAFLGGAREPGLADRADAEIAHIAAEEFLHVTGRAATPLDVARASMPAWDRTWTALENLELPDGIHLCANYESRVGIPGRIARARQVATLIAD